MLLCILGYTSTRKTTTFADQTKILVDDGECIAKQYFFHVLFHLTDIRPQKRCKGRR